MIHIQQYIFFSTNIRLFLCRLIKEKLLNMINLLQLFKLNGRNGNDDTTQPNIYSTCDFLSMKKEITNNIKWNQCHLDEIYITFSLPFRVTTEFCYVREIVCGPPCVCVRVCMDLRLSNDMVSCHSFNHVVIIVIVIIIIIIIGIGLLWRRICFMYLSCIYMSI